MSVSTTFADFWIPARKTRSTGDKLTTSDSGGNQEAAVINFRKIPAFVSAELGTPGNFLPNYRPAADARNWNG